MRSVTEGAVWPAIPSPRGAMLLALQFQLEETQWLPPDLVRQLQYLQLRGVLAHAAANSPYYKKRFADAGFDPATPLNDDTWKRVPFLTRQDLQKAGDAILSEAAPKAHGKTHELSTSGSTGMPVTIRGSELTQLFWLAFTLRDQLWQELDITKSLAAIRHAPKGVGVYPDGAVNKGWGPASDTVYMTGESYFLAIATPVEKQVEWLQRKNPHYILTYPSNLMALLMHCRAHGIRLPRLRRVETISEILHPEVREACREVWGVKIADMYSSQEVGYMALQCPKHEHYHVQSENVLLEILDDDDKPCRPGETGRIVVTAIHNYAMPLIRYVIGDYAVAGEPCDCGRGLPVMTRILGRVRNMLTLPDGGKMWPYFGGDQFAKAAPVRQYQIVQKTLTDLEVRMVPERPLTPAEEDKIRSVIAEQVGPGFKVAFSYHDEIARSKGGKFEDFRSELTD